MSDVSVNLPERVWISVSESLVGIPAPRKVSKSIGWVQRVYAKVWRRGESLGPISENARRKIWMCPELNVFSNYEYVYAIFPIAIALSGKRRKRNFPLKTIVFDLYNSLALGKYNGRKQLFCKNGGEMVLWRHGLKRACPFGPSRRLWKES